MDKAKTVSLHFTKEVRVDGKPTWSSTWHETQVPWSTLKSGSNVKLRDHDNFKNSQSLISTTYCLEGAHMNGKMTRPICHLRYT